MSDKTHFTPGYGVILRAALHVGLWWGLIETILLGVRGDSLYFSWGRYIAAAALIIACASLITLSAGVLLWAAVKRWSERHDAWALSALPPVLWVTALLVILHIIKPGPRQTPGFWLGYWYLLPAFTAGAILFFLVLRAALRATRALRKKAAPSAVTALLAATALIAPLLSDASIRPESRPAKGAPDIIFITLDTVRASHMASYGYFRKTTPYLDELAAESVVFENAAAQIPFTTGSHLSMLTSRYPSEIGMSRVGAQFNSQFPTLADKLDEAGYSSAAFLASIVLHHRLTKKAGFRVYDDTFSFRSWLESSNIFLLLEATPFSGFLDLFFGDAVHSMERDADAVTDAVTEWLKRQPLDRPVFIWAHYFDPHPPHLPPPPFDKKFKTTPALKSFLAQRTDLEKWEKELGFPLEKLFEENNLYDGELAYMDSAIERLMLNLERYRNGLKNAFVLVIADHGRSLGEHYYFGKVAQLYDPIVRVPFFIRTPDGERGRIKAQVSAIDVTPTILEMADSGPIAVMRGRSLVPLIKGESSGSRTAFGETLAYPVKYSARTPTWKLIYDTAPAKADKFELYNLEKDPVERKNLAKSEEYSQNPEVTRLKGELVEWIREYHRDREIEMAPLTETDKQKLRALGYIK